MRAPEHLLPRARRLAIHVVVLAVFASALAMSGSAYAFCPHAQRVMQNKATCCGGKHAKNEKRGPAEVSRKGCCEVRTIDALPSADTPATPAVAPPPVVRAPFRLVAAPRPRLWQRPAPTPPRQAMPIRAGPTTAAQRCALLQTFLR